MDSCCSTSESQKTYSKGPHNHHRMMIADYKKRFWISLVLSVPVILLSPMIQEWFGLQTINFNGDTILSFVLATIIYFYGGWPFLKGLWSELSRKKPGMMTLVALGISAAYFYSLAVFFGLEGESLLWELVTLVDIMLLGHWIEMRSVMGASKALEELSKLLPNAAHRKKGEDVEDIPINELQVGDVVVVKPGEKIPVDGVVIDGTTSVNEAMLTGESKEIVKKEGDEVVGGSINGEGSITVEVKKVGEDTYLSQITSLVERAQGQKSQTQNLANKAAMWLTVVAVAAGIITFLGWEVFTGRELSYVLQRTIAVVVIACPHALGLAIPLVASFSTSISAKRGILVKNRDAFENARNITTVIFDKTGTLTEGVFAVKKITGFSNASEEDILTLAASVEARSEHSLGKAIAKAANQTYSVDEFQSFSGKGVQGKVNGSVIQVVSPGYATELGLSGEKLVTSDIATVVYVFRDGEPLGAISLEDKVRDNAKQAVQKLYEKGIIPLMLTGDSDAVAKAVASELGIKEYFAEVLPDKKVEVVKRVQKEGNVVAMVGDGVNDAPALAQADIGIAIGSGTDVAAETADIILVQNDPHDVLMALSLGEKTYKKMIQNLWWASGYNVVALPLAAGVLVWAGIVLSPAVGAVLMSLSTVIVAFNATLLKVNT